MALYVDNVAVEVYVEQALRRLVDLDNAQLAVIESAAPGVLCEVTLRREATVVTKAVTPMDFFNLKRFAQRLVFLFYAAKCREQANYTGASLASL